MSPRVPHPVALALVLVLLVGAVAAIEYGGGSLAPSAGSGPGASGSPTSVGPTTTPVVADDAVRLAAKAATYERAPELVSPTGFVNAPNVSLGRYVGHRVVLVQFWTYGCVNCQHTLPQLNAWYDAYGDDGLVIVGVHTPEFASEAEPANVRAAVREAGIEYPVVLDNDRATWRAYGQRAWPTQYLIDVDGFVRYRHVGEGGYAMTEAEIRQLLADRDQWLANRRR